MGLKERAFANAGLPPPAAGFKARALANYAPTKAERELMLAEREFPGFSIGRAAERLGPSSIELFKGALTGIPELAKTAYLAAPGTGTAEETARAREAGIEALKAMIPFQPAHARGLEAERRGVGYAAGFGTEIAEDPAMAILDVLGIASVGGGLAAKSAAKTAARAAKVGDTAAVAKAAKAERVARAVERPIKAALETEKAQAALETVGLSKRALRVKRLEARAKNVGYDLRNKLLAQVDDILKDLSPEEVTQVRRYAETPSEAPPRVAKALERIRTEIEPQRRKLYGFGDEPLYVPFKQKLREKGYTFDPADTAEVVAGVSAGELPALKALAEGRRLPAGVTLYKFDPAVAPGAGRAARVTRREFIRDAKGTALGDAMGIPADVESLRASLAAAAKEQIARDTKRAGIERLPEKRAAVKAGLEQAELPELAPEVTRKLTPDEAAKVAAEVGKPGWVATYYPHIRDDINKANQFLAAKAKRGVKEGFARRRTGRTAVEPGGRALVEDAREAYRMTQAQLANAQAARKFHRALIDEGLAVFGDLEQIKRYEQLSGKQMVPFNVGAANRAETLSAKVARELLDDRQKLKQAVSSPEAFGQYVLDMFGDFTREAAELEARTVGALADPSRPLREITKTYWVEKPIADVLERRFAYDMSAMGKALRGYDMALSFVKRAVLTMFPRRLVNEFLGSGALAAAALGPVGAVKGLARYLSGANERLGLKAPVELIGGTAQRIETLAPRAGAAGEFLDKIDTAARRIWQSEALPIKAARRWSNFVGEQAHNIESMWKGIIYTEGARKLAMSRVKKLAASADDIERGLAAEIKRIEKGYTPGDVATITKDMDKLMTEAEKWLGLFSSLGPVEQWVARVIPFWRWQKHMTQVIARLPVDYPKRAALIARLARVREATDENFAIIPEWMKDSIALAEGEQGDQYRLSVRGIDPTADAVPVVGEGRFPLLGLGALAVERATGADILRRRRYVQRPGEFTYGDLLSPKAIAEGKVAPPLWWHALQTVLPPGADMLKQGAAFVRWLKGQPPWVQEYLSSTPLDREPKYRRGQLRDKQWYEALLRYVGFPIYKVNLRQAAISRRQARIRTLRAARKYERRLELEQ